jgi:hypothetical protein
VVARIARNLDVNGLETSANAHFYGWSILSNPRAVDVNPMFCVIEVEDHRRAATAGYNPVGDGGLPDFVALQQRGAFRAFDAILPEGDRSGSAVGIANGGCIRQSFNLSGAFLAIVTIADHRGDRRVPAISSSTLPQEQEAVIALAMHWIPGRMGR